MICRRSFLMGAVALAGLAPDAARAATTGTEGEGGIGGTGVYFGPLRQTARLTINGREIANGAIPDAAAAIAGQPNLESAVGDTLFMTARQTEAGLIPDRAVRFLPLVGQVDGLGGTGGPVRVMGTRVIFAAETVVEGMNGEPLARSLIRPGMTVAVSGVWRSGTVIATRIVALPDRALSSVSGQVMPDGSNLQIGETRITGVRARPGDFLTVVGSAAGETLRVRERAPGFAPYFAADRRHFLSATGYLAPDPDGDGYHLSGFGLPMDPASPIAHETRNARIFEGIYDRTFLIQRAI